MSSPDETASCTAGFRVFCGASASRDLLFWLSHWHSNTPTPTLCFTAGNIIRCPVLRGAPCFFRTGEITIIEHVPSTGPNLPNFSLAKFTKKHWTADSERTRRRDARSAECRPRSLAEHLRVAVPADSQGTTESVSIGTDSGLHLHVFISFSDKIFLALHRFGISNYEYAVHYAHSLLVWCACHYL